MIEPKLYLNTLLTHGIDFYAGVPDSLLRDFCACLTDTIGSSSHVIAANEGGAIGIAIGHHVGTGNIPLVYMQNSGLGNSVNPILSLASPEVYGIPMLLMIGWRGEPGVKDEPQHVHQGRVMMNMLEAMDIPSVILSNDHETALNQTVVAIKNAKTTSGPVAIIAKKGVFGPYEQANKVSDLSMTREAAIIEVASRINPNAVVIATTGMASRELYEFRASNALGHERDFLTVGGMGHASQIATGIAISQPKREVYCFDGDGATIMHLGSLGISGTSGASNLVHIVFNNGVHGSVGGQPTLGFDIDFCKIALACGYSEASRVSDLSELRAAICDSPKALGPKFVEIQVRPENRANIGRPESSPAENKSELMNFLRV